jgi:DNA-binding XRE family transcriptional regulator
MTAGQREAIRNSIIMIMVSTHLSQRQTARTISVSYETINRIFRFEDSESCAFSVANISMLS